MTPSATLTVVRPGWYTLVVDPGRPRSRSLGVPLGGAADRFSLALGNALVGNPPDAAALEVTLAGPTLCADADLACVLYGAPFELVTDRRPLNAGTTFTLYAGEELRIGGTTQGMRAYLCIQGGLLSAEVLGSRSSLGPLTAGTALPCCAGRTRGRSVHVSDPSGTSPGLSLMELRIVDGPQRDWFRIDELLSPARFQVLPASDRMGLRLAGTPLTVPARELTSEPVCPGAVQVTRDGQCIILGVDGQTIGGYPKIAHVIAADLDRLGQLRPGASIAFVRVSLAEAEEVYRQRRALLSRWLDRLHNAQGLVS